LKVAICLYGLPRGNVKSWKSIIDCIVKPLNADVFIHTWQKPASKNTHTSLKQPGIFNLIKYFRYFNQNSSTLKCFKVDEQYLYTPEIVKTTWGKVYFSNGLNNLTSIYNSSKLLDNVELNTGNYDLVIFTRPDIVYTKKIEFEMLLKKNFHIAHGGLFVKSNNRYECEDLLMIFERNSLYIWNIILNKYRSQEYLRNDIYNILIYEAKVENKVIADFPIKFLDGLYISRPFDIVGRLKNKYKILFNNG
jgi:hypothetical protein